MDVKQFKNVTVFDHPLIKHKITILRDVNTNAIVFRRVVKEVAILEGYEALRDLPTQDIEVETPIEKTMQPKVESSNILFVPILRAGLGMTDGFMELVPNAKVGHLGMYRDEVTHEPVEYYNKMPQDLSDKKIYLLDPMFATGGSAMAAVQVLKNRGAKDISFICIIAAPEGVERFCKVYPDVPVYIGALDRCLNEKAYICPGLGDCGDRIFNTVKF